MKVLQVNCVYNNGSTGKIVKDLHTAYCSQGIESCVCYGRGSKINEPDIHKTCGEFYSYINHFCANLSGILYGGCFFSTNKLIETIQTEKPDIVHLHCLNGYFVNIYRLVNWLKANRIRTVLTLHAEFMYTGGCGHSIDCNQWSTREGCGHSIRCPRYRSDMHSWFFDRSRTMWKRMKHAFEGFEDDMFVASVSPWLMQRAQVSPILKKMKHTVILNGLDTNVFHPYDNKSEVKAALGISENEKMIFHATPSFSNDPDHIKGGYYVLQIAKAMAGSCMKFVVAGPYPNGLEVPNDVILLGKISNQNELAKYYSAADVTLLTSQRETFSMVTAESLCCGTPVAGFRAGAPETICIPEYSYFCDYGDLAKLAKLIKKCVEDVDFYTEEKISEKACKLYSKENMALKYRDLYQKLLAGE